MSLHDGLHPTLISFAVVSDCQPDWDAVEGLMSIIVDAIMVPMFEEHIVVALVIQESRPLALLII